MFYTLLLTFPKLGPRKHACGQLGCQHGQGLWANLAVKFGDSNDGDAGAESGPLKVTTGR